MSDTRQTERRNPDGTRWNADLLLDQVNRLVNGCRERFEDAASELEDSTNAVNSGK